MPISDAFGYHPPRSTRRVQDHERVRDVTGRAADELASLLPSCAETDLAIFKIREAMMWANAALALAPDPDAEVSADEAAAGP